MFVTCHRNACESIIRSFLELDPSVVFPSRLVTGTKITHKKIKQQEQNKSNTRDVSESLYVPPAHDGNIDHATSYLVEIDSNTSPVQIIACSGTKNAFDSWRTRVADKIGQLFHHSKRKKSIRPKIDTSNHQSQENKVNKQKSTTYTIIAPVPIIPNTQLHRLLLQPGPRVYRIHVACTKICKLHGTATS